MKPILRFLCASALACSSASAAFISLTPVADTTISQQNQAHTNPESDTFIVGRIGLNGAEAKCRALMRFDLSSLPSNVVVTSATLTVSVSISHLPSEDTLAIHRLTNAWTEGGATWDAAGLNPGADFNFAELDSTQLFDGTGAFTFPSTPEMVAAVQGWMANSNSNNGWVLLNQNEVSVNNGRRILTREAGSGKPTLTIGYTAPPMPLSIHITNPRTEDGQFAFDFTATAGHSYTVEYKNDLNTHDWTTFQVIPDPGTDMVVTVFDDFAANRFFRVVAD